MTATDKKEWLYQQRISYGEMGKDGSLSEDDIASAIYDSVKEDLYNACLDT